MPVIVGVTLLYRLLEELLWRASHCWCYVVVQTPGGADRSTSTTTGAFPAELSGVTWWPTHAAAGRT